MSGGRAGGSGFLQLFVNGGLANAIQNAENAIGNVSRVTTLARMSERPETSLEQRQEPRQDRLRYAILYFNQ